MYKGVVYMRRLSAAIHSSDHGVCVCVLAVKPTQMFLNLI